MSVSKEKKCSYAAYQIHGQTKLKKEGKKNNQSLYEIRRKKEVRNRSKRAYNTISNMFFVCLFV